MPPRANQSNAALYSAIFFAAVFIAATVFAVVFYLKAEDYRKQYQDTKTALNEIATAREKSSMGKPMSRKSYLGTMLEYFNQLTDKLGTVVTADATADVKFNETVMALEELYDNLEKTGFDANSLTVSRVIDLLNKQRLASVQLADDRAGQLKKLSADFDAEQNEHLQSEKKWQDILDKQKQIADSAQQRYKDLQALIDDKFGEQISSLTKRYQDTKQALQDKEDVLLKTKAQLSQNKQRLEHYLGIIESIKPQPLKEVKAFKPDGQIVSVDPSTGIVILNLGSDDHVYPGLTFSVYNKNAPIPPDGKGKADVEIFDVDKRISIARIKPETVDPRQSIIAADPIANLIWDADATNTFVVAGEFDIDNDGGIDIDGQDKIKQMILDWNGRVANDIDIKTDFVVLGTAPVVGSKPDGSSLDTDPAVMEKYEKLLKAKQKYDAVIKRASEFSIPVFDITRFMYFIGQGDLVKG